MNKPWDLMNECSICKEHIYENTNVCGECDAKYCHKCSLSNIIFLWGEQYICAYCTTLASKKKIKDGEIVSWLLRKYKLSKEEVESQILKEWEILGKLTKDRCDNCNVECKSVWDSSYKNQGICCNCSFLENVIQRDIKYDKTFSTSHDIIL